MADWKSTRPANAAAGTTHMYNGVTYVARKDGGQTVWDVKTSQDPHASGLVSKFERFNFGAGDTSPMTEGIALIDKAGNARYFGYNRNEKAGKSPTCGEWINLILPAGESAHSVINKEYNTYVITNSGKCYGIGRNDHREMGLVTGTQDVNNTILTQVKLPQSSDYVSYVNNHADLLAAFQNQGATDKAAWGKNHYDNNGRREGRFLPQTRCVDVQQGVEDTFTTYFLMSDGKLYGAGYNPHGWCFGTGNEKSTDNDDPGPYPIEIQTDVKTAFLGGSRHAAIGRHYYNYGYILKHDGTIWTTGYNGHGQRGLGTVGSYSDDKKWTWTKVAQGGMVNEKVVKIKTASQHGGTLYALTDTNRLYCWGYNGYGQLTNGTTTSNGTPYLAQENVADFWVTGGTHYTSVYIKKQDGNIYAAGYNGYGQLGDNTTAQKTSFTRVRSSSGRNIHADDVSRIFTSSHHAANTVYAVTASGELYGCGHNGYGQLGLGDHTNRHVFTEIPLPTPVSQFRNYTHLWGDGNGVALMTGADGEMYGCGSGTAEMFNSERNNRATFTRIHM